MGDNMQGFLTAATCGAAAALIALAGAGVASADPVAPSPPPPPPPALAAEAVPVSAAAGEAAPTEGVPHLPSPDALPPGSTMDPAARGNESPNVSYLRDLWQAVQNNEVSGKEALIMGLAQRGMNTPYPEQAAGPNVPRSPGDAPPPPPAPLPPAPAPLPVP
jgi:hypothetical protein